MPNISIITVTYNPGVVLHDCVLSVRSQNIPAEYILIDGGSTGDSRAVIEQNRKYFDFVLSEPDKGIYDAMNKGIGRATGDIIGILNSDDYYHDSNVLSKVLKVFEDKNVDACYGDLVYVDSKDSTSVVRYWKSGGFSPKKFFWGWMPPHPTFFVRKHIYEKFGLFNINLGSAADYEIMLRFLLRYHINAVYIPEILVHMRSGGVSNASISNRLKANRMDRFAWKVNELKPYPWTLWFKPLRKILQWIIK